MKNDYEKEAIERWGDLARQSQRYWASYSEEEREAIKHEGWDLYTTIAEKMEQGADSAEVQALVVKWHDHLRHFYEPSIDLLRGLGTMYHDDPAFNATFTAIDPGLPGFLKEAILIYVDVLETRWLERELGLLDLENDAHG